MSNFSLNYCRLQSLKKNISEIKFYFEILLRFHLSLITNLKSVIKYISTIKKLIVKFYSALTLYDFRCNRQVLPNQRLLNVSFERQQKKMAATEGGLF